jgi:hypothetical protein
MHCAASDAPVCHVTIYSVYNTLLSRKHIAWDCLYEQGGSALSPCARPAHGTPLLALHTATHCSPQLNRLIAHAACQYKGEIAYLVQPPKSPPQAALPRTTGHWSLCNNSGAVVQLCTRTASAEGAAATIGHYTQSQHLPLQPPLLVQVVQWWYSGGTVVYPQLLPLLQVELLPGSPGRVLPHCWAPCPAALPACLAAAPASSAAAQMPPSSHCCCWRLP